MICYRCGHPQKDHYASYTDLQLLDRCAECHRWRSKKSEFYKHVFEDNLSYIERKAKEKNLV